MIYNSSQKLSSAKKEITSYYECVNKGGIVIEKYPAECSTPDGDIFEQPLSSPLVDRLPQIQSFDDCVAAGYPIAESYPPQCYTPDGRNFTMPLNRISD